ncbi:MAG: zeta toxin family protein [Oscillospiraceae bacterium]|nr:zeta toxin family protein [Oscillospiraceae bacterium]
MKIYTIIGGVNGCGKSSLTGALKAERTDLGMLIDVDKLNAELGSIVAGGKEAIRKINYCLERGISFTQETTLSGIRTERTIRRAKEQGYRVRLYYVGLDSLTDSLQRIENRVRKGGHDIPQDDVKRRYESRYDDLLRILPYCDGATFFDNDNGFVEVAEYVNGELILKGQPQKDWIKELYQRIK